MPWKVDQSGNLAKQDNNPVFIDAEGKEASIDLDEINRGWAEKLGVVNRESANRRTQIKELQARVEAIGDLDLEEAKEALKTVANYKDKDLIQAKDAEAAKAAILRKAEEEKAGMAADLDKAFQTIRKLGVSNAFAHSRFFAEKTTLTPDAAEAIFGGHYQVEDGQVIAHDDKGSPIYSSTSGDRANFEEAAAILWGDYPHRDHYKPSATGGGAPPGGSGRPTTKNEVQKLEADLKAAQERKDLTAQFSIGRRLDAAKKAAT